MYREAWRLQRDFFWTEDMSGVDWEHVYQRYLPLLDRIATRGEFSDLMWEMQGELGTSHAYEWVAIPEFTKLRTGVSRCGFCLRCGEQRVSYHAHSTWGWLGSDQGLAAQRTGC